MKGEYMERLFRKLEVCRNSGSEDTFSAVRKPTKLNNFLNVDAMGEEEVREATNIWEDEPKIYSGYDPATGKYYIVPAPGSYFLSEMVYFKAFEDTV